MIYAVTFMLVSFGIFTLAMYSWIREFHQDLIEFRMNSGKDFQDSLFQQGKISMRVGELERFRDIDNRDNSNKAFDLEKSIDEWRKIYSSLSQDMLLLKQLVGRKNESVYRSEKGKRLSARV